jgi:hypothetical protein
MQPKIVALDIVTGEHVQIQKELIRIYLGGSANNYIDIRQEGDFVEVRSPNAIEIEPRATNVIRVRNQYWNKKG